jgi:hypothetical protein
VCNLNIKCNPARILRPEHISLLATRTAVYFRESTENIA